ncbi:MAG: hypothetical protein V1721_03345 [Pseudomonadota bacterium]
MKKVMTMFLFALLLGCGKGEVDLVAGYKYVQLDGSNHAISDRDNRMVVDPNVKWYRVIETYIMGERDDANIDPQLSKQYGYFILDTRNGQLIEGLSKFDFQDALRARHLNPAPF